MRSKTKAKVILVMPAHNAAKTLFDSFNKIPKGYVDEVILVDDASSDKTLEIARKLPMIAVRNHFNLGYGGNLKVCLAKALERGADVVIEYHPDNQYEPINLPIFIRKAYEGYDFAIGSRFIHPQEAIDNQMPLIKFIANRAMSFIDRFILGIELSEFHSGFRMYTRKMLSTISYLQNSDDYLFSFEVIVQAVYKKLKIAEVAISCKYHKDMHTANIRRSTIYAIGTFKTLLEYVLSKFFNMPTGPFMDVTSRECPICSELLSKLLYRVKDSSSGEIFGIHYCLLCKVGFTSPLPDDLERYYPKNYYLPFKSRIYNLLQLRRPHIINNCKSSGRILDIGCGDGSISNYLKHFEYVGIETSFSGSVNKLVKQVGIEKMNEKPNSYDIVTFWESFEHMRNPLIALQKTIRALKKGGAMIIECPNFSSYERNLFKSRWFHLDPPRHTFHFTPLGLKNLLKKNNMEVKEQKLIYAPEYTPVGLAQSMLYSFSPYLHVISQKEKSLVKGIIVGMLILLLLPITIPLSVLLYIMGESPILLTVANKN